MDNNIQLSGKIEITGKSINLIAKSIDSSEENIYPLIEVPNNVSECYKFGLWEAVINDFDLSNDNKFINHSAIENQIQEIQTMINDHFNSKCDCDETIDSQKFLTLDISKKKGIYRLEMQLYSNRSRNKNTIEILQMNSVDHVITIIDNLLQTAIKNNGLMNSEVLDLTEILYDRDQMKLEIGSMFERWFSTLNKNDLNKNQKTRIESIYKLIMK
jgi:hypothetical protein